MTNNIDTRKIKSNERNNKDQKNDLDDENTFDFKVNGFGIISVSFLLISALSITLSDAGWSFSYGGLVFIFIVFPLLYEKLGFFHVTKNLLRFCNSKWGRRLSFIPGVTFNGKWFIENESEKIKLKSPLDIVIFLKKHWVDFILIHTGFVALFIRIFDGLGFIDTENIEDIFELKELYIALIIVPIFMAIYFTTIWVWEDAELKIAVHRKSTLGGSSEITELKFASESLRNIVFIFMGIETVSWLLDFQTNLVSDWEIDSPEERILETVSIFATLFFYTGGITLLMGIMYYRSGTHEKLVNNLRYYIRDLTIAKLEKDPNDSLEIDNTIGIYRSTITPIRIDE